jgi:acyl-CoA thioesterase I
LRDKNRNIRAYGRVKLIFNVFTAILLLQITLLSSAVAETIKLIALGDSLTAGYGLPEKQAFTNQLQRYLVAHELDIQVINAGVSGDTSAGGFSRLDWTLSGGADFVLLELGANDALRGLEPSDTRNNLAAIIEKLQQQNIPVLLAGMKAPPNLGNDYVKEYDAVFPRLASKYNTGFYPFFLDGVAAIPSLNQNDGIHPNEEGVKIIINRLGPVIKNWIAEHSQS